MSITGALKGAGYTPEKSTAGDKPILNGVYKAMLVEWKNEPNGKFGPQVSAAFKITERLAGSESRSTFPEFRGYYATDEEKVNSKRNGLAKLLNGFFSVGKPVNTENDEAFAESMNGMVGSAEVYIKGYKKTPRKQENGVWVENPDGDAKQDFTFMTEKNALKEAQKMQKKAGHPL